MLANLCRISVAEISTRCDKSDKLSLTGCTRRGAPEGMYTESGKFAKAREEEVEVAGSRGKGRPGPATGRCAHGRRLGAHGRRLGAHGRSDGALALMVGALEVMVGALGLMVGALALMVARTGLWSAPWGLWSAP